MGIGNRRSVQSASQVPQANIPRSRFDLSKPVKDTYEFDLLNPVWCQEILPGDTFNVTANFFARLSTQQVPVMDNMYIDCFFFFVPTRLVYDKWEQLQGANIPEVDSSTDYIMPQITFAAGGPEVGTIFDKFGLPTDVAAGYTIKNSTPFRGYMKIWNDWFRDENLQDMIPLDIGEGPDVTADFVLQKRGKRHDYFTSALPWPQKGPSISIPLGTTAPVNFPSGYANVQGIPNQPPRFSNTYASDYMVFQNSVASQTPMIWDANLSPAAAGQIVYWGDPALRTEAAQLNSMNPYADLSDAASATINQLRQSFMIQQLYELDARGGTRYVEAILARFNVVSPDFRLQRAEYLGGGKTYLNVHPVAQNSQTTTDSPQGNLASFATATETSNRIGFSKSFTEHGYVYMLMCARADITYQQGVDKMWNRSTRFDFYEPSLADLGEQAILNKEIYVQGTSADENVFGYAPRWDEYRQARAEIRGQFRSTYAQSLDFWHLAEEFSSLPALNASFILQSTPVERIVAVPSEPDLLFDGFIKVHAARPMPVYAQPAKLGRF